MFAQMGINAPTNVKPKKSQDVRNKNAPSSNGSSTKASSNGDATPSEAQ